MSTGTTLDLVAPVTKQEKGAKSHATLVFSAMGRVEVAELGEGESMVLGRRLPSELIVRDPTLSAQHARLRYESPFVVVTDLDSKNGLWLRSERVTSATLGDGDGIRIGAVHLTAILPEVSQLQARWCSFTQFAQKLSEESLRARTLGRPLALLLIESSRGVEHAKWCPLLASALGRGAWVAPYGGDWFAVLLPESGDDEVLKAHQRIERILGPVRFGLAVLPRSGTYHEELLGAARKALRKATSRYQVTTDEAVQAQVDVAPAPVGPVLHKVRQLAERAARSRLPVLILGETGTGKEVLARQLHQWSPRACGPFHVVNCGALPENLVETTLFGQEKGAFTGAAQATRGAFEQASGGTLLLDEIGELPLAAQAALLRTLESRHIQRVGSTTEYAVDVRIVAATHQNLEAMVQQARFRLDLFHRLNAVTLCLPPLRERIDEIPALVEHFLRSEEIHEHAPRQLSKEAMDLILRWSWPGNIRELRNVLERAAVVALGSHIEAEDLPESVRGGLGDARRQSSPTAAQSNGGFRSELLGSAVLSSSNVALSGSTTTMRQRLSAYEATLMHEALIQTGGHKSRAAGLLKMPLRTFMKRLKELGL